MALKFMGNAWLAVGALAFSAHAAAAEPLCDKSEIKLVNIVHGVDQEYHGLVINGGKAFTEWAGLKPEQFNVLVSERDPSIEVSRMRSFAIDNPKCTVFNVEPAADQGVQSLVDVANETGAWLVTHWGHGGQSHPWDPSNTQWIAHINVPGVDAGKLMAEEVIAAMGGKGGLVAIQGNLANDPAVQRFAGLKKALEAYPEVVLLDDQTATWDRAKAFQVVQSFLSKYGDQINGIWVANDAMAFGAIEALRAANLAGKIPLNGLDATPEAVEAIKKKEMVATAGSDGYYQGSIGLAMGYCVLTGQVPPPSEWRKEDREFYLRIMVVNAENAEKMSGDPDPAIYAANDWPCDKIFGRNTGPAF